MNANKRKKKIAARKAEMKQRTAAVGRQEIISPELSAYYDRMFCMLDRMVLPYNMLGVGIAQFAYDIFCDVDLLGQRFEKRIREKVAEKGENPETFKVIFADRDVLKDTARQIEHIKQNMYRLEKSYIKAQTAEEADDFFGRADALFELVEPLRCIFEMIFEPADISEVEKRVKVTKAHIEKLRLQMDRNRQGALTLNDIINKI